MNQIPTFLYEALAGGGLAIIVVPIIVAELQERGEESARAVTTGLALWVGILLVGIGMLLNIFSGPVARALLSNVSGCSTDELAQSGAQMLKAFAVQLPLYGFTAIAYGALHARARFAAAAVAPVVSSLVAIATYVVTAKLAGPHINEAVGLSSQSQDILIWGTNAAVCAMMLVPAVAGRRHFSARLNSRIIPRIPKRFVRLAGWGLLLTVGQQVGGVAVLVFSSRAGDASTYILFTYAWTIFLLPVAVTALPIVTSTFPDLAYAASMDNSSDGVFHKAQAVARPALLLSSLTATALACAGPAMAQLLVADAPGDADPSKLVYAIAALMISIPGYVILLLAIRTFFALHAPWPIVRVILAGGAVTSTLAAMSAAWAPSGTVLMFFALSHTLGTAVAAWWAVRALTVYGGRILRLGRLLTVIVVASGVASLVAWCAYSATSLWHPILTITITGLMTAAIYAATVSLLDRQLIGDATAVAHRLKSRRQKASS